MKIGQLSRATGTNVETIRYYERIRLLPDPERTEGNYRDYGTSSIDRLSFIRHARGLGFEIPDIRSLLDLADNPERNCGEADGIVTRHLRAVEAKIGQLTQLREELDRLAAQCRGGQAVDCRILAALGDHSACEIGHHRL